MSPAVALVAANAIATCSDAATVLIDSQTIKLSACTQSSYGCSIWLAIRPRRVMRPYLGVSLAPPSLISNMGREGVLVMDVAPNGPAARAGVKGTSR
jgi:S1-C subfamily serine protease